MVRLPHFVIYSMYRGFNFLYISAIYVITLKTYLRFIRGHALVHFYLRSMRCSGGLDHFFLRFPARPLSGLISKADPLPVKSCCDKHSWHYDHWYVFFSECVPKTSAFSLSVLSAVTILENLSRDLLRSSGSSRLFHIFNIFRGGSKMVERT